MGFKVSQSIHDYLAQDNVLVLRSPREEIRDHRAHLKLHIPHVVSLDSLAARSGRLLPEWSDELRCLFYVSSESTTELQAGTGSGFEECHLRAPMRSATAGASDDVVSV
jgi:hypothetical protein